MSTVTSPDLSKNSGTVPKKKSNKKKKNDKGKIKREVLDTQEIMSTAVMEVSDEGEAEDNNSSAANTPQETAFPVNAKIQTNGSNHAAHASISNGRSSESPGFEIGSRQPNKPEIAREISLPALDSSLRFEVMSQEREALRAEVGQLRKSLEEIQGKHIDELRAIKELHAMEVSEIKSKYTEEVTTIRGELEESESAKETAETQYQHLLGRINTIKSSLGERLKADKQELAEVKEQVEELESQNAAYEQRVKQLEINVKKLEKNLQESSNELSNMRSQLQISQQNWSHEREDLIHQKRQLADEADAAKEAMGDWEVLAMEERSMREGLMERIKDIEEQLSSQKDILESTVAERDAQSQVLEGLQRALQELQDARKQELRELVESYEEQVQVLKKRVQESDARAVEADSSSGVLKTELERLAPFEKEVKEKNLLIGKLRHEAIVLNDHLTKALRFLKKAKPEDNIDRQIVTNHFLHFLALDRSDPKKFQILQIIAALLNWSDEQKEQAGLARPGTSNNTLRLPTSPFHRTPSTPSLSTEFLADSPATRESLAELWTGFLERSAEEGSINAASRSGSVSSAIVARPDTRGSEGGTGGNRG